jgi:preprotein translocase subunit YajC
MARNTVPTSRALRLKSVAIRVSERLQVKNFVPGRKEVLLVKLAKRGHMSNFIRSFDMGFLNFSVMLAMGAPPQGQSQQPMWISLFPLVLLIVVFYVALIRPQQKKAKAHAELLKSLKANDRVVTSSGIMGVVISVKDRTVTMRSADSKFEVVKSAIAEILERGEGGKES